MSFSGAFTVAHGVLGDDVLGDDPGPEPSVVTAVPVTLREQPVSSIVIAVMTISIDLTIMRTVQFSAPKPCSGGPPLDATLLQCNLAATSSVSLQGTQQELVDERSAERGLGVIGRARVAALDVLVVLNRLASSFQCCRHLPRVTRMHTVITG